MPESTIYKHICVPAQGIKHCVCVIHSVSLPRLLPDVCLGVTLVRGRARYSREAVAGALPSSLKVCQDAGHQLHCGSPSPEPCVCSSDATSPQDSATTFSALEDAVFMPSNFGVRGILSDRLNNGAR